MEQELGNLRSKYERELARMRSESVRVVGELQRSMKDEQSHLINELEAFEGEPSKSMERH